MKTIKSPHRPLSKEEYAHYTSNKTERAGPDFGTLGELLGDTMGWMKHNPWNDSVVFVDPRQQELFEMNPK